MSITVPAESLLPLAGHCPVCSAAANTRSLLRLQSAPPVMLRECQRCFAVSAERVPNDDYLRSLYEPSHYASSLVSDVGLTRRCASNILGEVTFDADQDIAILDYGGSDGILSRELRAQLLATGHRGRITSTVVDLFPRKDSAVQRFVTPEDFFASDCTYDFLIASAVLEHLPDLHKVLLGLTEHACPGAYFYARTPYDAPLHRLVPGYRVKWPRHLHDLGPKFWDNYLEVFNIEGTLLVSRPSIVETSLRQSVPRTVMAHVLKAPGRLEASLIRPALGYQSRFWRWVGGWEVIVAFSR